MWVILGEPLEDSAVDKASLMFYGAKFRPTSRAGNDAKRRIAGCFDANREPSRVNDALKLADKSARGLVFNFAVYTPECPVTVERNTPP
jgi:hypothetical protein